MGRAPARGASQLFWAIRSLFLSREQRDAMKKLAGYALLEPR
jgi:hypothetical protein